MIFTFLSALQFYRLYLHLSSDSSQRSGCQYVYHLVSVIGYNYELSTLACDWPLLGVSDVKDFTEFNFYLIFFRLQLHDFINTIPLLTFNTNNRIKNLKRKRRLLLSFNRRFRCNKSNSKSGGNLLFQTKR